MHGHGHGHGPATESTPLLGATSHFLGAGARGIRCQDTHPAPPTGPFGIPTKRKYLLADIWKMIQLALEWHYDVLALALLSASLNIWLGMTGASIFHPLVFRCIFVVFGFLLGFRNVRANNRIELANRQVQSLFSSIWMLIVLFPDNAHRRRITKPFVFALRELADYVAAASIRHKMWFITIDMKPAKEIDDAGGFDGTSPRPLLQHAIQMVENEAYNIEGHIDGQTLQTKRRMVWPHIPLILKAYDDIMQMCLPAVSDRYAALLDVMLYSFMIVLPWGLVSKPLDMREASGFRWAYVSADVLLIVTVTTLSLTMMGLNALAQDNEGPFRQDTDQIPFDRIVELFVDALDSYERSREHLDKHMPAELKEKFPWRAEVCLAVAMTRSTKCHDKQLLEQLSHDLHFP